jgi:predicted nucleic-acid-binding protein
VIGIDTNVLVRHLVQDDAAQAARATALIEGKLTRDAPGFINRIVVVELIWVLEASYGYARDLVADLIDRILRTAELIVEDADAVSEAVRRFRASGADLADLLLAIGNERLGCSETYTFDRRAARTAGFAAL